jgi:hypothetical protein
MASAKVQPSTIVAKMKFLSFHPRDEASAGDSEAHDAIRFLNDDFAALLKLPAKDFWDVVTTSSTLPGSLDSYLRYKRCCICIVPSWDCRCGCARGYARCHAGVSSTTAFKPWMVRAQLRSSLRGGSFWFAGGCKSFPFRSDCIAHPLLHLCPTSEVIQTQSRGQGPPTAPPRCLHLPSSRYVTAHATRL